MKDIEQLQQKVGTDKIVGSKNLGLKGLTLLGILSLSNVTGLMAQDLNSQERNDDGKEILTKTPTQVQNDSMLTFDEALNGSNKAENQEIDYKTVILENLEKGDKVNLLVDYLMRLETVQDLLNVYDEEYIRETLKREINQALKKLKGKYSDEFINKSIEEIINNSDISYKHFDKVIKRCVSDNNFQNAIKNGDNVQIKMIIEKSIKAIESNRDDQVFIICIITLFALVSLIGFFLDD